MRDTLGESLRKLNWIKVHRNRFVAAVLVLSLIVSMNVFWVLRKPGVTLAGDADCGLQEHTHKDSCDDCGLEEHVHSIQCYSDDKADTETALQWQDLFADYPYTGDLGQDLVGIAQTQVGYAESTQNYELGADGIRRGYTRYGAWYGSPYGDWSAMFVSFCLHYAGADPEQYPGNIGAASMAKLWEERDRFGSAGDYTPQKGDLVFFTDNTVGIVAEAFNATVYVIRGDVDGVVDSDVIAMSDEAIAGWGMIGEVAQNEEPLPDLSNGPVVIIYEGASQPQMRSFTLRSTRNTVTDLVNYLNQHSGSYFFTLLDTNNQELPKDENGNYIAHPNIKYRLTISFVCPDGFLPGEYVYQIPNELLIDGGTGSFILEDKTDVGTWEVTSDGQINLKFNNHMNNRTDITISATMGIRFIDTADQLDFDGKIFVTVEKPPEEMEVTEVSKWGSQGNPEAQNKTDDTKLYWTVQLVGKEGSNIVGSLLTDKLILGDHSYTASDMANGVSIGVSEKDPVTGAEVNWHLWTVYPDDPNMNWTETGWEYIMPTTAVCKWCGEIQLQNDNWVYIIDYTSTPNGDIAGGSLDYMNRVEIDGQFAEGWAEFQHGEIHGDIVKNGKFLGNATGGGFYWELQAIIPGMREGKKADYAWFILDYMDARDGDWGLLKYITNDADNATVTAYYGGKTITVPRAEFATEDDPFAWHVPWSPTNNGVEYGRQIELLCRCNCTAETCQFWNGTKCTTEYWFEKEDTSWTTNGYCQCWTAEENVTFTFAYQTNDMTLVDDYGGHGNFLRNEAVLYNKVQLPNGTWDASSVKGVVSTVPVPGMFQKSLVQDFDGYTAKYRITVNEGKMALTNGTPMTIHDVMTETLAFISGSLVITTEDQEGNLATLQEDLDYTVSYDGSGNVKENGKPVHILDVVILNPQPVKYILDYDTALIIPIGTTQAVKYSNYAYVTIWGQDITASSVEKVYADINIAAKTYKVEMYKTSHLTGQPLPGATFGLFNAQGGRIATGVTGADGTVLFETDIVNGIILREHVLYYIQELKAPKGYRLDSTKFWFCFCNDPGEYCREGNTLLAGTDAIRIPFEQIGHLHAENHILHHDLPATGGTGIYPFILVGVSCIATPLVYEFIRRRKQGRRHG